MRELKNGTKIIGVDTGYGNIKTANTVTPTGLITENIIASAKLIRNSSPTKQPMRISISSH